MVKIPERPYAQLAGGRLDPAVAGSGSALAVREVARGSQALLEVALRWQDQRDHSFLVEAQNAYGKAMTDWTTRSEQERQGGAAQGFAKDYTSTHASTASQIARQLEKRGGSGNAVQAFNNWATQRETVGAAQAMQFEHRQMQLYGQDMHALRVQEIESQLGNNPASFADAFQQLEESFAMAVGQGVYRPEQARVLYNNARDKLKVSAFENLYAQNRGLAMKSMGALGLDVSQQARAKKRYQADLKADAARARAGANSQVRALNEQLKSVDYLARVSGDTEQLRSMAEQYSKLGQEKTASLLVRQANAYDDNIEVIKESNALPLPELANSIRLQKEALPEYAKTGPEDSTEDAAFWHKQQNEQIKLRQDIYEARLTALKADPVQAVAAISGTPAGQELDLAEQSERRLAAQAENGLPSSMRRVLANAEAATLKERWQQGDLAQRLAVAADVQAFGSYAAHAAAEVGIGAAEQVLLHQAQKDKRAQSSLADVIRANSLKPEQLPKLEKQESLARNVTDSSEVIKGYKAALAVMPSNQGLAAAVRNLQDTAGRLVSLYGGDTAAVLQTMDGSLKAMADSGFALVYDSKEYSSEGQLEFALQKIGNEGLESVASNRTWTHKYQKENWIGEMKRSGRWINAPDGSDSFIFIDSVARAPVMDEKGNTIRASRQDVLDAVGNKPFYDRQYIDPYLLP